MEVLEDLAVNYTAWYFCFLAINVVLILGSIYWLNVIIDRRKL
jgi:hypothetical protein